MAIKNARGRPRDEDSRKAILKSALAVLKERGYSGFAIEAVAARAKTGKTTIYRWWPNRAALAVEAFFDQTLEELAFSNDGSAAEDFRQQLKQLAALLRGRKGEILAALITGSRTDGDLRLAIEQRWVNPRRQWGIARMHKAILEGEVSSSLDIYTALESLYSPLYNRLFLGLKLHSDEEIDRHCNLIFQSVFLQL